MAMSAMGVFEKMDEYRRSVGSIKSCGEVRVDFFRPTIAASKVPVCARTPGVGKVESSSLDDFPVLEEVCIFIRG